jgi:hypothetical protein
MRIALSVAAVFAALGVILLISGFREAGGPGPGDQRQGGAMLAAMGAGLIVMAILIGIVATLIKVWS